MDIIALFDRFRSDVADEENPPLWNDEEIWDYMNDAQRMFCRLTWGISDSRGAVTQLQVDEGDVWAAISPDILTIRSAKRTSDFGNVVVASFEQAEGAGWWGDDYGMPKRVTLDDSTGTIKALVTGMEENRVRLYPIPSADELIQLTVYRLPQRIDSDAANEGAQLEIKDMHHLALLLWMKHLAYAKQDAETFDKGKSDEYEAMFQKYCFDAKKERERLEQRPGPLAYGGI